MTDVLIALDRMHAGDRDAASKLFPLIYDELRRIAIGRMNREKPGNTLQATALVHEAWLRIMESHQASLWESRESFFAAAAETMRRILVDAARRKSAARHGGEFSRKALHDSQLSEPCPSQEIIAVNDAMEVLEQDDRLAAELVRLHYFAGMSLEEAGELLGMSRATAYRTWTYARTFLRATMSE